MSARAFFTAICLLAVGVVRADAADVVSAARRQVGVTVHYDPAYRTLAYPNGDLPPERGVCTDVVIRALRVARGLDLQAAVHEDIRAHTAAYPLRRWRASRPDASIDHRRVPNLMVYFARQGYGQPRSAAAGDYLPGDIVAWDLGRGILHVGIITDRKAVTGAPFVVHNIGAGTREEDILFRFDVVGHYRLPPR